MKIKALLYCCKTKPYLLNQNIYEFYESKYITSYLKCHEKYDYTLNGKIAAECDYEVEGVIYNYLGNPLDDFYGMQLHTKTLKESEIVQLSKIYSNELRKYLLRTEDDYISPLEVGYAIHVENLHIFDEPKKLNEFDVINFRCIQNYYKPLENAPRNIMYVYDNGEKKIIIPVSPQEMCRIANKEQTTLVRRRILKEMINNE